MVMVVIYIRNNTFHQHQAICIIIIIIVIIIISMLLLFKVLQEGLQVIIAGKDFCVNRPLNQ